MREDLRSTIVAEWERVDDDELEHLFSRYLYRVARWSHRRPAAREFTVADIDLFKGIPPVPRTPAERYHLAVQSSGASAVGDIAFVPAVRRSSKASDLRARFQLDAPVIARAQLFARVSFLLDDQRRLVKDFEASDHAKFAKGSRHRYVPELFLAALFYWVDAQLFDGELDDDGPGERAELRLAWDKLFVWAFGLRLERQRVTWQSVNLRAISALPGESKAGVFEILRDALSTEPLRRLLIEPPAAPDGRDQELAALLAKIVGGTQ